LRRDLAQEGDQVQPPESSAAGPAFGSRLHGVPTPTRTGARAWQRLHNRAMRLHARELEGESAAFLTMAALTFAAYYLSR
jgi:hypothetical protein